MNQLDLICLRVRRVWKGGGETEGWDGWIDSGLLRLGRVVGVGWLAMGEVMNYE